MYDQLRQLCESEAADRGSYVLSRLRGLDVDIEVDTFRISSNDDSRIYTNYAARLRKGNPSKRIAYCAHYDKTEIGQGALDNGAAVIELLSTLEHLLTVEGEMDITFLFFDGEENHKIGEVVYRCVGSRHYVNDLIENEDSYDAVFNFDVTGKGDTIYVGSSSFDIASGIYFQNDYVLQNNVIGTCVDSGILRKVGSTGMVDAVEFFIKGIPAVTISALPWEEIPSILKGKMPEEQHVLGTIHTERDIVEAVQPETLEMMRQFMIDLILRNYVN